MVTIPSHCLFKLAKSLHTPLFILSMQIRINVLALVGLLHSVHGRDMQGADAEPRPHNDGSLNALQALSNLLVTSNAAAPTKEAVSRTSASGFNPSSPAARLGRQPSPLRRARAPLAQESGTDGKDFVLRQLQDAFKKEEIDEKYKPMTALKRVRDQNYVKEAETEKGWWSFVWNLYWGINLLLSFPISYVTFYVFPQEIPNFLVAANLGTFPAMFIILFVIKSEWDQVSSDLLRKDVYYLDGSGVGGLFGKKDKEELYRDRIQARDLVRPARKRIDQALLNVGLAFILTNVAAQGVVLYQGDNGPYTLKTLTGDKAREFIYRLKADDDFAAEEQRRALSRMGPDGKMQPVYCNSRYYRILGGGDAQGGYGCNGS